MSSRVILGRNFVLFALDGSATILSAIHAQLLDSDASIAAQPHSNVMKTWKRTSQRQSTVPKIVLNAVDNCLVMNVRNAIKSGATRNVLNIPSAWNVTKSTMLVLNTDATIIFAKTVRGLVWPDHFLMELNIGMKNTAMCAIRNSSQQ